MANVAIVVASAAEPYVLTAEPSAHVTRELSPLAFTPIVPPSGTLAAGGPTVGQLFPVGNR